MSHEVLHDYVLMGLFHSQQSKIEESFLVSLKENTGEAIDGFWRDYLIVRTGRDSGLGVPNPTGTTNVLAAVGHRSRGQGALSGRRGIGSANQCMHGPDAVIEEIIDWRPYDYVTDRATIDIPAEPVRLLHTIEFEPTPEATTIHLRSQRPIPSGSGRSLRWSPRATRRR